MVALRYSGVVASSKEAITFEIKEETLEKVIEIENAAAASFEYFDLVVEAFHKAASVPIQEVVGNFVHIVIQGDQETIETGQPTGFNPLLPSPDLVGGLGFGQILLEPDHGVVAQPFFETDILDSGVDQLQ